MKAQTNVTMPIEEYNKLLEIQKTAMENSIIIIVGMMGHDTMIVQSKDETIKRLGEIITRQTDEINKLDKDILELKYPKWPTYEKKPRYFWKLLFDRPTIDKR